MPTVAKTPCEVRVVPIDLTARISEGAAILAVVGFASRHGNEGLTNLSAPSTANATTLDLLVNPGLGARLTINDGASTSEVLKVSNVSGSGPFTCTITPAAMYGHATDEDISYEVGVSTRLLISPTVPFVGTEALPMVQRGAHGQTYRVSVVASCDNGELIEGEVDLVVDEFLDPIATRVKQPGEVRDLFFGVENNVGESGLASALAFVSQEVNRNATLSFDLDPNDGTLALSVHPGVGALLVVGSAPTQEIFSVSAVSGGGPYDCTITPTAEFFHGQGQSVVYEQGESTRIFVSVIGTILGNDAKFRAQRGDSDQVYRLKVLAALNNGEVLQPWGHLSTQEI